MSTERKRTRPATTPRQDALVRLLRAAGSIEQALDRVCEEYGITHDQYNVLRILRGVHPEGHPRYAIAERLIRRAPDVTRLIGRLVREGLVERYNPPEDRRLSMSRLTGAGFELLDRMDPEIRGVHESYGHSLSTAEAQELSRLCGAIAARPTDS